MALASGTSVPFGPPFVSKCISLAQCSIVYFCHCVSHVDTIKDYVMLCYDDDDDDDDDDDYDDDDDDDGSSHVPLGTWWPTG